jgi:hypothetical protein
MDRLPSEIPSKLEIEGSDGLFSSSIEGDGGDGGATVLC